MSGGIREGRGLISAISWDFPGVVMLEILLDLGILGILDILDHRGSPFLVDWIRLSQGLDAMLHFRWRPPPHPKAPQGPRTLSPFNYIHGCIGMRR